MKKFVLAGAALACAAGAWAEVLDTSVFTRACTFTLAGYEGASTLAGFPVLVRLSPTIPGFDAARCGANGAGLRFTDVAGNLLAHEVDTWDVDGESCVWVKVPALSGTATQIRLYYGAGEGVTLPAVDARSVWSSYVMVAHGGAAGLADSSPKNLALKNGGSAEATSASGLVGGGISKADRNPAGVNVPNPVKNGTLTNAGRYTLSAWFRSINTNTSIIMSGVTGWGGSSFLCLCEGGKEMSVAVSSTHQRTSGVGGFAYDKWAHVAFSYDTTDDVGALQTYFDGANIVSLANAKPITDTGVDNWSFGSYAQTSHGSNFQGDMDELRIYDGVASADWIKAEYDTMNKPAFAQTAGVSDISAGHAAAVSVASAVRGTGGVTVKGMVLQLPAGAASVRVALRWGETPALEGGSVDVGSFTGTGDFTGTFPGTSQTALYYYAFTVTPDAGEATTTSAWVTLDDTIGPKLDTTPFKRACTFTLQGYSGTETLQGMPVLVRLSTEILGFDYGLCAPDGADLRFVDVDGRLLAHEIESWNPAGESCVWVKVPQLAGTATKIRAYFDVDDVSALPGIAPADVWNKYVMVAHGGAQGVRDSSAHALTLLRGGTSATGDSGLAGGGFAKAKLTRGSQGLQIPNPVKYNLLTDTGRFTLSGWFRNANTGTAILMSSKSAWGGTGFLVLCEAGTYMSVAVQSTHQGTAGAGALQQGKWNHVAFSYVAAGQLRTYFDGANIYQNLEAKTLAHEDRDVWTIGSYVETTNSGNFGGDIDEVRLYDGIASADWLKAEYESVAKADFAKALSVDNLVDVLPSEVKLTSLTRTEEGVVVGGSLARLATGAQAVTVKVVWGTTPEMTDGTVTLGTYTEPSELACTFPGLDASANYYFAFVLEDTTGGTTTSAAYRAMEPGASAVWRPQSAADTWFTTSWLLDGTVLPFQPGWNVSFDGAETTTVDPIEIAKPVDLGALTVGGDKNYTLTGEGGIKVARVEKTGTGTLTVDGRGFVGKVDWDVAGGTLRLGDGVSNGSGETVLGVGGTVTVHEGAALDINNANAQTSAALNDATRAVNVKIVGDGPDGKGALVNKAAKKDGWNQAIRSLELTGDASVGGDARLDVRPFTGTGSIAPVDAVVRGPADATLRVLNTQRFNFKDTVVEQLGAIRIEDGGRMHIEATAPMNLTRGLELGENGTLYYANGTVDAPVIAKAGTSSHFGSSADTSRQNGPLTVEENAVLTVDGGSELNVAGPVVNNGTIVAKSGTLNFYGSSLAGTGVLDQQGATVRLSGTLDSPDFLLKGSTTGGAWDIGQEAGYGYPNIAGIDFGAKGTVYLRTQISDTLDGRWATFLGGTADGNLDVICRANGETDVTTTLAGVKTNIGHLKLASSAGSGHMVLAEGTELGVSKLHVGANDSAPKPGDLTIATGAALSIYTGDGAMIGEWSGRSGSLQQVFVDGGTYDGLTTKSTTIIGYDAPFAYMWLNDGVAKVNKFDIRNRMGYILSTGSTPAFDARFTQRGGTLHLGDGGFTSGVAYFNTFHADLANGRVVNEADWTTGRWGLNVAFGTEPAVEKGAVSFDLGGHSITHRSPLMGYSDVTLTGGGSFTTLNALQAIPLGHWTVAADVTANLAGASGFADGLSLDAGADATLDISGTRACEFGILMTNQWVLTAWTDVKNFDGTYPMTVDRLRHLHARLGTGLAQYSVFAYRGQFYVEPEQAGTWTFAGGYDDHILLEVDGADVLKNESWNTIASASTQLTAGWHDFRVFAFDKAGGAGSPVEGWSEVMNLGWTVGTPANPTDAAAYQAFDTTTLPMRVKPVAENVTGRTGVLWELGGYDQNAWDTQKYFLNERRVVGSLKNIHAAAEEFPKGRASASRFTGFLYVTDVQAGVWDVTAKYDDGILFKIDDTVVGTSGNELCKQWTGKVSVAAGWHRVEIRVSDKSGGIGAGLTDSEGNKSALNIAVNGLPAVIFDERHFRVVASVLDEQTDRPTGLGGATTVAAGARLANAAATGFCPVYGSLGGAGTVEGAFRFTRGTLAVAVNAGVLETPTFVSADAAMFADLGGISVAFDAKPKSARYVLGDAYGLTPAAAAGLTVTATVDGVSAAEQQRWKDGFRATVQEGQLVLLNRRGAGMTLVIR